MLRIKLTQASRFQTTALTKELEIPIKKKKIFIGRGEELLDLENKNNGVIDLTNFDNTLSRIHAFFSFSPAWFRQDGEKIPGYLYALGGKDFILPEETIHKIWEFIKPKKQCILWDSKSKLGIFKQISVQPLEYDSIIQFVHQSFIHFHRCLSFQSIQELIFHVTDSFKKDQNVVILGNLQKINENYNKQNKENQKLKMLKLWQISAKDQRYLLLVQNDLVLRIGRSSHCEIQIKDSAISRYQAYLKCERNDWRIFDGNQIQKSKNGTWKKSKFIKIAVSACSNAIQKCFVKIGTIKCEIELIQKFQWINFSSLLNQQNSQSFIRVGMHSRQEQNQTQQQQQQKLAISQQIN